jgi:Na+/H+ antiporter NhaD/arsenite permease-like protein
VLTELFLPWFIGLVMMLVCGYFLYDSFKKIRKHIQSYRKEKAEKKLLWWYLDWIFQILDLFGRPERLSLIVFLIGTLIFVAFTIKIVGRLFGYSLLQ